MTQGVTAATISALQAIHEAILASFHSVDGLVHAPDGTTNKEFPTTVTTALLPFCTLRPGPYDLQAAGRNIIQARRTYRGAVLVYPLSAPADEGVNAAIVSAWGIMDAYRTRYETLVAGGEVLSTGDYVTRYQETLNSRVSAEGIDIVVYRKTGFLGFVFAIDVWESD